MKLKSLAIVAAVAGALCTVSAADAAFSEIVNINAAVSGITQPNGDYADSTLVSPLQVALPAGTYTGSISTPLLNALAAYTAWTYQDTTPVMPYLENFAAFDDNGGAPNTSAPVINFSSPTFAYGVGAVGAAAAYALVAADTFSFSLTNPTTLDFVVPDNFLSDNAGGVSVLLTANVTSVPEPVSLGVCAVGATLLLKRRRRV